MKENKIIVLVDPKLYSLEAVYGAAYAFLDKAYIYLEEGPKSKIQISLKGKEKLTEKESEALKGEFLNELLNFSLRDKISKNNKKIREYIVARTLTSSLHREHSGERRGEFFRRDSSAPNREHSGERRREFFRRDFSDIAIPWDNKSQEEYLKEEFVRKPIWRRDPRGIVIPWGNKHQEQYPKEEFIRKPVWEKDPSGIAIPWKEKQEQKQCKNIKKKLTSKKR